MLIHHWMLPLYEVLPFLHKTGTTETTGEGPGITTYRFDNSPVKPTDPGIFFITNIILIKFRSTQILCSFWFVLGYVIFLGICFAYAFKGAFQM